MENGSSSCESCFDRGGRAVATVSARIILFSLLHICVLRRLRQGGKTAAFPLALDVVQFGHTCSDKTMLNDQVIKTQHTKVRRPTTTLGMDNCDKLTRKNIASIPFVFLSVVTCSALAAAKDPGLHVDDVCCAAFPNANGPEQEYGIRRR